ncbi:LamG-like jellyroll fold domain-containing protein [Bacteroidota bacterium]
MEKIRLLFLFIASIYSIIHSQDFRSEWYGATTESNILDTNLVAYYPFNGNTNDESGNNHNGISHGITYGIDRIGIDSSAAYFNGSAWIELPDDIRFQPLKNASISYWLKTSQGSRFDIFNQRIGNFSPSYYNFGMIYNYPINGKKRLEFNYPGYHPNLGGEDNYPIYENVDNNEWQHFVFVKESSQGKYSIYINGELYSEDILGDVDFDVNGHLIIGKSYNDYGFYTGLIDDIRIYNRALTHDEILCLVNEMGIPCPGIPTVTYEGKIYNTVLIGDQCWLKENLDVGTMIDSLENASNNGVIEKYCYKNNPSYCDIYGALYQWNEAMLYSTDEGARGICPNGWHIPSTIDNVTLLATVNNDGNALKAVGQGSGSGTGTNTSGFSALLAGNRHNTGYFDNLGYYTTFWNSTDHITGSYYMVLYPDNSNVHFYTTNKNGGMSIRCLMDESYSLYFDGSDNYVDCGNGSVFNQLTNQLTVEAWIKTNSSTSTDLGTANPIISKQSRNPLIGGAFMFYFYGYQNQDQIKFHVNDEILSTPYGSIQEDIWNHVAGVYDGSQLKIYINGELKASKPFSETITQNNVNVQIGQIYNYNSGFYRFDGNIDEVKIWNRALGETEIRNIQAQGRNNIILTSSEELIGYWPLNEGSGTITNDLSGNGNHGTIHGAIWSSDITSNTNPILFEIPDQSILEGDSFNEIKLDRYVTDYDHSEDELAWTYSGNTELTVTINGSRVATIGIPDSNWNGSETITLTATDPGGLSDSDSATFTVNAINDPPVVSDIPDQEIAEGEIFSEIILDNYVLDIDDEKENIIWTYSGNVELEVEIDEERVASISQPNEDWYGSEEIVFTASDLGELSDRDTVQFTINPVNDAPILSGIPDIEFNEDDSTTILLSEYAADVDNEIEELVFTADVIEVTGEMKEARINREIDKRGRGIITVGEEDLVITIDNATKEAKIESSPDSSGIFIVEFIVTDDSSASGRDTINIEVKSVNDGPKITGIPDQEIAEGEIFSEIILDNYVLDIDDEKENIIWTYSGNVELEVEIDEERLPSISQPNEDWYGSEEIVFTASDLGELSDRDTVQFTINPVNDAPIIISTPVYSTTQNEFYEYDVEAQDVDKNDILTFSLITSPAFLSIDDETGTITGIPYEEDVGIHNVTVKVEDIQGEFDQQSYNLTVENIIECGDVNCDSQVFAYDAALLLRYIVGSEPDLSCPENGDIDLDGYITAFDSVHILRHIVGLTPLIPTCFGNPRASIKTKLK